MAGNYQNIYDRINAGSSYTPLSAQTFGDWSIEAGDVVTVWKGLNQYTTPVMRSDLEWKGASKVTIESTGNPERTPLNKISKRKYSESTRTGGGYYNSRNHQKRIDTQEDITSQAGMYIDDYGVIAYSTNTETMVGSRFLSLNNRAEMSVGKYQVDVTKLTEYGSMAAFPVPGVEGRFYGDASTNKVYVWKTDSSHPSGGYYQELKLSGGKTITGYNSTSEFPATGTAGRYYADTSTGKVYVWDSASSTYVETQMDDHNSGYYIKAGEICVAINEDGSSTAFVKGDRVVIGNGPSIADRYKGKTLDGTVTEITTDFTVVNTLLAQKIEAEDITADFLASKVTYVNNITAGTITASGLKIYYPATGSATDVATQDYVEGCPWDLRYHNGKLQWKRLGYTATWADVPTA